MSARYCVESAQRILRGRQLRYEVLGAMCRGFGEPAWDMLLQLFVNDARGETTTVGRLVEASAVERQTAVIFLGFLSSQSVLTVEGAASACIPSKATDDMIVRFEDRGRERLTAYLNAEPGIDVQASHAEAAS